MARMGSPVRVYASLLARKLVGRVRRWTVSAVPPVQLTVDTAYGSMVLFLAALSNGRVPVFEERSFERWIGGSNQRPFASAERKWEHIKKHLPESARCAVDIGCNNGYFSLSLARAGVFTLGIDSDERLLRIAREAARRARIDNIALSPMGINSASVWSL